MKQSNADITAYPNPSSLAEIMQQNKTRFALCRYDDEKKALVQCHQFVQCRDFMHDAFVAVESNRSMSIYGFKFNNSNPRPDYENTSLLVEFPDDGTLKNFQENFPILKEIEEGLGYAVSYPELVKFPNSKKAIIWLLSDKKWQDNALAFSLFGFLLKCFGYKITDKSKWKEEIVATKTNEAAYMNIPWVTWLLNGGLNSLGELYTNYSGWKTQDTASHYTIHDCSGFVSVGQYVWEKKGKNPGHVLDGYKIETR